MEMIPVHRPQLPTYDGIQPYLEKIDRARWYSNFGPLLLAFETRIAEHFNISDKMIATASNGTLMLIAMLKALDLPANSLCIMPSWTFIATPAAACYAGLTPYFVDVDRHSQALDPVALKKVLNTVPGNVGCIIVVTPFGSAIDFAAWETFAAETGVPVLIDAAAGFDMLSQEPSMRVNKTPIMISLHATKVLGIGEGGLLCCADTDYVKRVRAITSFGFNGDRQAQSLGFNAKLSEFAAAVGLAALDDWHYARRQWEVVRDYYLEALADISVKPLLSSIWVNSTCNIILPHCADTVASALKAQGIDTRKWWSNGCHKELAYKHYPHQKQLANTEWLSQSVLGLPMARDLSYRCVTKITAVLSKILEKETLTS